MTEPRYELFPGVFANLDQCRALDQLMAFLDSPDRTFTLAGRGGTGKTTIVKKVIERAVREQLSVGGGAVSHAAKEVLGESIGQKRVHTVASLLAIKLNEGTGNFEPDEWARQRGAVPVRDFDLLVIDETSMISEEMMQEILREAKPDAKIIFMGDNVQLPPIGDGDEDSPTFLVSKARNYAVLTDRVRQGEDSPIVVLSDVLARNIEGEGLLRALSLEDRKTKYDPEADAGVIFSADEDEVVRMLVVDLKKDPGNPRGSKAVVFNNERYTRSSQSVLNLNKTIRKQLYGERAENQFNIGEIVVCYAQWSPKKGSQPVVHNAISYVVDAVSMSYQKAVRARWQGNKLNETYSVVDLTISDHTGRPVTVPVVAQSDAARYQRDLGDRNKAPGALYFRLSEAFANIQYGYAITSHKAQGSTYRNVYVFEDNILGMSNRSAPLTKNKSLYVAVTRPSHKLVMHSEENTDPGSLKGILQAGVVKGAEPKGDGPPVLRDLKFADSLSTAQNELLRALRADGLLKLASEIPLPEES